MATTIDYRNYRADYTAALINKMINSEFITSFTRNTLTSGSLKINIRQLKGSELISNILHNVDLTKVFVSNIKDFDFNNKKDLSEIMFLIIPLNQINVLITYYDYLKLKLNKFTSILVDLLNVYLQCFEKVPENNGYLQPIS